MPPTRLVRYCCSVLKETGGANRFIATGVRWAESVNRKNSRGVYEKLGTTKANSIILNNDNDDRRMLFENCKLKAKQVVNPIVDWTDEDVWTFIRDAKTPRNPLYEVREAEFLRWPQYKVMYLSAFDRMLQERRRRNKMDGTWRMGTTANDVFNWWMEYDILPGQIGLDEYLAEEDEA